MLLFNWLSKFNHSGITTSVRRSKRRRNSDRNWPIEQLESRILLAAPTAFDDSYSIDRDELNEPADGVLAIDDTLNVSDTDFHNSSLSAQVSNSHFGSSPVPPPEKNDHTFFVDQAGGLDTGCTFSSGGPLVFSIPVDRVVGDVDKLKANGKISPTAQLEMPAFDVDFNGSFPPERDRVFFNGHVVPGEYLTGSNGTWKLNEFDVPIDWVNFPTDASVPAMNTIQIDIDVHPSSSGSRWCTAIDWASLSVEEVAQPVLFVHGIISKSSVWSVPWQSGLDDFGILNDAIDLGSDQGFLVLDSIAQNAQDIAARVNTLSQQWGVDSFNIVSHSKGGLDSRHFAEGSDKINTLIQIGTPNAGSPLADLIQVGLVGLTGIYGAAVVNVLAGPGGIQLTTPYMALYNIFHGLNPDTNYVSLAGDYTLGGLGIADFLVRKIMGGQSDLVVPVSSVHSLASATKLTFSSSGLNTEARHIGQVGSSSIFNILNGTATTPVSARSTASVTQQTTTLTSQMSTAAGLISEGESSEHVLPVDGTGPFLFSLLHTDGVLNFSLVSPTGVVIDPAKAVADPNIGHETLTAIDGLLFQVYEVSGILAEPGLWTLQVFGDTVTNASGLEPFFLTASSSATTLQMDAALDQESYLNGDTIIVAAALMDDGQPVTGASVHVQVVLPDDQFDTFILSDGGIGNDIAAGDGIYTGAFSNTTEGGTYRMVVQAEGTTPHIFGREKLLLAPVTSSHSQFTGLFSDRTVDTNGNGLFDQLIIDAEFDVTEEATYRFLGMLTGSDGTVIEETVTVVTLDPALHVVPLVFDGARIFQNRVDGPYFLSVKVAEEDAVDILPLTSLVNVHQTAAYSHLQFEHPEVFALGTGDDQGIDLDGNGLFDQLLIRPDIFFDSAGNYTWTARLEDVQGTEIGFTSSSGFLPSGVSAITLLFDGETIGSNGVDGPYLVKDLLIFSSSASANIASVYSTTAYRVTQFEGSVLPVDIDIKPESEPNSINLLSKGKIPVAVLSTATFDASALIDRDSLTFGTTGDETSLHRRGNGEPNCGVEDVNNDSLPDLVCHFMTQQTGFENGSEEGILRGLTIDGALIEGRDSVNIVPDTSASSGPPLASATNALSVSAESSGLVVLTTGLTQPDPSASDDLEQAESEPSAAQVVGNTNILLAGETEMARRKQDDSFESENLQAADEEDLDLSSELMDLVDLMWSSMEQWIKLL